jgi:hypothetical protein
MQLRTPFARRGFWLGVAVCALAFLPTPARAFDTGHHADLTREVLHELGFSDDAIRTAQVQSWLVDYSASSPAAPAKSKLATAKLHCDNLDTPRAVRGYWQRLMVNSRRALRDARASGDPVRLLTVLGASLHTVQDFYSHSNWVELHPRTHPEDPFYTVTWFDRPYDTMVLESVPGRGGVPIQRPSRLRTGRFPAKQGSDQQPHGDYCSGLNKDSYIRPRWAEAYVFAYCASRQWVQILEQWSDEDGGSGLWDAARGLELNAADRAALARDVEASQGLSEWVRVDEEDGHWKGSGSGDADRHQALSTSWLSAAPSRFVREFNAGPTLSLLADRLDGSDGNAPSYRVTPVAPDRYVVLVRTVAVERMDTAGTGMEAPSFYAETTVNGQRFKDATQRRKNTVEPAWTTIRFVKKEAATPLVSLRYELRDEGSGDAKPVLYDVNPLSDRQHLEFSFDPRTRMLAGDLDGVHDTRETAIARSGGDAMRTARVFLYVTARSLAPPPVPPASIVRSERSR